MCVDVCSLCSSQRHFPLITIATSFEDFVKNVGGDSRPSTPELTDVSSMADVSMSGVDRDVIEITSGESSCSLEFLSPMSRFDDSPARLGEIFEQEPEITEEERILTKPVQELLDVMNSTSTRINEIESELSVLENRRLSVAELWSNQKTDLVQTIGVYYIEKTRPLFDAYQEQQKIQSEVNTATASFSAAVRECEDKKHAVLEAQLSGVPDEELFVILESYLSAQRNRETYEQLSQDKMLEFRTAQNKCQEIRKSIGLRTIERAWPWFEAYNKCRVESDACTDKIRELRKEMKISREKYKEVMSDLESISAQVHQLRNQQN